MAGEYGRNVDYGGSNNPHAEGPAPKNASIPSSGKSGPETEGIPAGVNSPSTNAVSSDPKGGLNSATRSGMHSGAGPANQC